jgi:hypothetical protein
LLIDAAALVGKLHGKYSIKPDNVNKRHETITRDGSFYSQGGLKTLRKSFFLVVQTAAFWGGKLHRVGELKLPLNQAQSYF